MVEGGARRDTPALLVVVFDVTGAVVVVVFLSLGLLLQPLNAATATPKTKAKRMLSCKADLLIDFVRATDSDVAPWSDAGSKNWTHAASISWR